MDTQRLLSQIDHQLEICEEALKAQFRSNYMGNPVLIQVQPFAKFRASGLSFLEGLGGIDNPYYREFEKHTQKNSLEAVQAGIGILGGLRAEVEAGWYRRFRSLVASDIFADFISMAEHLLESGYKDASAVLIGSVLEGHLRQLAEAHDVKREDEKGKPLSAGALNDELARAAVYNKLDHKSVMSWLDLRNKAAHGHYDQYAADQVAIAIQGIMDFTVRIGVT